jgi:Tfp pilus assembly protein PilZ
MKPQELMTLALRVLAVFIASRGLVYLADAAVFVVVPTQNQFGLSFPVLALISLLGPAIAAIVVWWCAPYLARLAARGITDVPVAALDQQSIVGAVFVAAGVLIFILALPGLVGNVVRAFGAPGLFVLPSLVASVVQCILGAVLVVGARVTSRLLLRLRYAGTGAHGL